MTAEIIPFQPPPLAPRNPRFVPGPTEVVQLAGMWDGGPLPVGWDAEEKIDGIRCAWIEGQLYSREGAGLEIPHVAAELARLERRFGQRMMVDGEYQEPGGFLDTLAWHSSRGKRKATGTFHLFDAVPLDDWRADACEEPLTERRRFIAAAIGDWEPRHLRRVLPLPVGNRRDVEDLAAAVWARGGEGLMLKDGASLYRRERSTSWLKVKRKLALSGIVREVLHGGKALSVEIGGRKVRVSSQLRPTPSAGMHVSIEAMEWSSTGALRQGIAVGIGRD